MNQILFDYNRVPPTTWVYLSSLLAIALYFKFGRLWSLRNLDLIGLILLAPGLLLVIQYGQNKNLAGAAQLGYIWLFVMAGFFVMRLFIDPMMVRRPLIEPNMTVGGLTFLGGSLFLFLMANVVISKVADDDVAASKLASQLSARQAIMTEQDSFSQHGPGYPLLFLLPHISTRTIIGDGDTSLDGTGRLLGNGEEMVHLATSRTMAILSHLAIVLGIVFIGYRHFENIKTGIAAATLYLLLPYTAQLTGRVDHALPAALLIWAIAAYRQPLIAGVLIGLAIGVIYYPTFLLPLWLGFYWQRGSLRFALGILLAIVVLVGMLALTSADHTVFFDQIKQMFGWRIPIFDNLSGFWQFENVDQVYRIPVLAAFLAACGGMAIWPAQKNLGTLISYSAAVMLATQFWHAYDGGLYMAWYLPLLILVIFRPNLENRVALSVLGEGWWLRKWGGQGKRRMEQAA